MIIRQSYGVADRVRLFLTMLFLLLVVIGVWRLKEGYVEEKSQKVSSIESLLEAALEPVGSTMYIWGGGWDDADNKAGATSTQIGLSPRWENFAKEQDETYNFEKHRFERENGLDCSGYVGWVIYNTFETENGQQGYVTTSTDIAESLAARGWGILIHNPKEFMPGDIVSMEGHVWICLGTCEDGSVLLVHSSPPGVSVCGTVLSNQHVETDEESMAVQLATEYMTKYHSEWQERYPSRKVSCSYLENVYVFRWNEKVMLDAKELQKLSGEEIFVYMSPDV